MPVPLNDRIIAALAGEPIPKKTPDEASAQIQRIADQLIARAAKITPEARMTEDGDGLVLKTNTKRRGLLLRKTEVSTYLTAKQGKSAEHKENELVRKPLDGADFPIYGLEKQTIYKYIDGLPVFRARNVLLQPSPSYGTLDMSNNSDMNKVEEIADVAAQLSFIRSHIAQAERRQAEMQATGQLPPSPQL